MEVGKLEFEGKRCYSFEEISALENRLSVLEDVVQKLNTILIRYIDEATDENRKS